MNNLFSLLFILFFHPVHVSMMGIDYDSEKSVFNVYLKIYYDDFVIESGFNGGRADEAYFRDDEERSADFLEKYLGEKVSISVNGRRLSGELIGMELSNNELNIRLKFNCDRDIKTITVRNLIMTSLYSDQSNMLLVKVNDFEEGVKLTALDTEKTFGLE